MVWLLAISLAMDTTSISFWVLVMSACVITAPILASETSLRATSMR